MNISRRTFLGLPLALPVASILPVAAFGTAGYHVHHDHVMGTSLDLVIFAASERDAAVAEVAVLDEIARLSRILSTYDPDSEVSRARLSLGRSAELSEVLGAYEYWNRRTVGSISPLLRGKVNLDALGKPFIASLAVKAARACPGVSGVMLDAGGDVVVSGRTGQNLAHWTIGVSDPRSVYYDAEPMTLLNVSEAAVVTSGRTARGEHIIDPRTGVPPLNDVLSATVIAPDGVTANALSTAICVLGVEAGIRLVESSRMAECLIVTQKGHQYRSIGFAHFERPIIRNVMAAATWPAGFEVMIDLNLKAVIGRRPYVAVWVTDLSNKLVRNIILFAGQPRFLNELHAWWNTNATNPLWYSTTRPTPAPGRYVLRWDGLAEHKEPMPQGTYKIFVETAREDSYYEKEFTEIACEGAPATATIKGTPEFGPVPLVYGPKKQQA